jgi:hypothetical protein
MPSETTFCAKNTKNGPRSILKNENMKAIKCEPNANVV